jgi:hypothetical protein
MTPGAPTGLACLVDSDDRQHHDNQAGNETGNKPLSLPDMATNCVSRDAGAQSDKSDGRDHTTLAEGLRRTGRTGGTIDHRRRTYARRGVPAM